MKKRWMIGFLASMMITAASPAVMAQDHGSAHVVKSDMAVKLNGKALSYSESYLIDSTLFVPYRAFAETIGATVGWDDATRTVTVTKDLNTVKLAIDATSATVNGVQVKLAGPATIMNDVTFVPARFLAETFGIQVGYEENTRTVNLTANSAPSVSVIGVADGETIYSDKVQVATLVANHGLVDFTKNPTAKAGEGHVHLWLDTDANDPKVAVKQVNGEPVTFDKLTPGEHTLTVVLVGNDHKAVEPLVKKVIKFKTAVAKEYTIDISNFKFSNPELTIEVGSIVTFVNKDKAKHNAVADDGSFATPLLAQGESATVQFTKAGEFPYVCVPHKANMKGKIIVK